MANKIIYLVIITTMPMIKNLTNKHNKTIATDFLTIQVQVNNNKGEEDFLIIKMTTNKINNKIILIMDFLIKKPQMKINKNNNKMVVDFSIIKMQITTNNNNNQMVEVYLEIMIKKSNSLLLMVYSVIKQLKSWG